MRGRVFDGFLGAADKMSQLSGAVAALFLAGTAAVMVAEIAVRFFLGTSLLFTWEMASYLMSAMFFWGAAYTLSTGGHVRVGLLLETVPARVRLMLEVATTILGIAVAALIAAALVDLAWQSYLRGVRSFTPQQTPLFIPQGLAAVGACIFCLQMTVRLIRIIAGVAPERELPSLSMDS